MRVTNRRGAFTLIEVLIATILVGLAIAALVAANGSFTLANGAGADLSTAEFLVEQIRELTTLLPVSDPSSATWDHFGPEEASVAIYDDVDDFDGFNSTSLGAPISAQKTPLNDLAAFSQRVTVQNVNRSDFDQVVGDRTSNFIRVTVRILQNGREITSASWIRAKY